MVCYVSPILLLLIHPSYGFLFRLLDVAVETGSGSEEDGSEGDAPQVGWLGWLAKRSVIDFGLISSYDLQKNNIIALGSHNIQNWFLDTGQVATRRCLSLQQRVSCFRIG